MHVRLQEASAAAAAARIQVADLQLPELPPPPCTPEAITLEGMSHCTGLSCGDRPLIIGLFFAALAVATVAVVWAVRSYRARKGTRQPAHGSEPVNGSDEVAGATSAARSEEEVKDESGGV